MKHAAALALLCMPLSSHVSTHSSADRAHTSGAEAVVTKLYDLVTFQAGTTPDWDEVRALFVDEAVVVLRTGREEMSVFSLDGFVADFVRFIEQSDVKETGFTERILGMKTFEYGDIAHVLVLFDSHVPGSDREPSEGIDSFELVRRGDDWRIVSIVNERPTPSNPIPDGLFDG